MMDEDRPFSLRVESITGTQSASASTATVINPQGGQLIINAQPGAFVYVFNNPGGDQQTSLGSPKSRQEIKKEGED